MAWYFRRRVKILPGLTLNFSKSGTSATVGGRGYHVNISKRGTVEGGTLFGGLYWRNPLRKWGQGSTRVRATGNEVIMTGAKSAQMQEAYEQAKEAMERCLADGAIHARAANLKLMRQGIEDARVHLTVAQYVDLCMLFEKVEQLPQRGRVNWLALFGWVMASLLLWAHFH